MMSNDKAALIEFTARWVDQFTKAPQSEELHAMPSPCIIKTEKLMVYWKPVLMTPAKQLTIVETLIGITLHPSAHVFYGTQYADNMHATWQNRALTLIQIWNDDDFCRLEQNLINHLSMQKKLKRVPTIFIASTNDDSQIITLNNISGEIVNEDLITGELSVIAPTLADFLSNLSIL